MINLFKGIISVFATKSDFLIVISLQSDGVNLSYFKINIKAHKLDCKDIRIIDNQCLWQIFNVFPLLLTVLKLMAYLKIII